jgi:hypothetical protein
MKKPDPAHFPVSSQLLRRSSVYLVLKLMLFPVFAATVASVAVLIRIILAKFVSLTENVRQFFIQNERIWLLKGSDQ